MTALILVIVGINLALTYLIYNRLVTMITLQGTYQAEGYKKAVERVKRKPMLPFKKEQAKGRTITPVEDLVDIADIPWEDGYKALEDL